MVTGVGVGVGERVWRRRYRSSIESWIWDQNLARGQSSTSGGVRLGSPKSLCHKLKMILNVKDANCEHSQFPKIGEIMVIHRVAMGKTAFVKVCIASSCSVAAEASTAAWTLLGGRFHHSSCQRRYTSSLERKESVVEGRPVQNALSRICGI